MSFKGKIGIGILVLVIVIGAGLAFAGKGQFFGGRFNDRDARGSGGGRGDERGGSYGRGGGSGGEGEPSTSEPTPPDLAVLTIEPSYVTYEPKPGTYANYYRHNVKFAHTGGDKLPAKYDWKIFLNGKEYTKLALNTLPSTWPYYAFDVLDSVACPSFNVFVPSIRVEIDPANAVAETNENNNTMISNPVTQFGGSCYNASAVPAGASKWLTQCMAINRLAKAAKPKMGPVQPKIVYSDVGKWSESEEKECKAAAEQLAAGGTITGTQNSDGTYSLAGNAVVTRAEAAKLLGYLMTTNFPAIGGGYPDVPATAWYYKDVTTLLAAGKVNGKADLVGFTDGLYRPDATALTVWFKAMIAMLE